MRPLDYVIFPMLFIGLYTAIFFLYTYYEKRKEIHKMADSPKIFYSVTIIVPAFNEENTILKTLNSLLSLNYPKDKLKIMVVDDGSTDNTFKVVKNANFSNVVIYRKQNGGKYTALNYGLERCDTEFVGALDADSFVSKDALKNMVSYFDDPLVMAVTPSMRVYKPKSFLQRVQAIEYLMGLFLRKIFSVLSSEHVTPGPFTIHRKAFFDKHGFYKKAFHTEDIEVALRIQSNGYKIRHASNAAVYTVAPKSFNVLYKQRIRWYYGFIENLLNYKHLFSIKYGILGVFILPIAFVSVIMVLFGAGIALFRFFDSVRLFIVKMIVTHFDIVNYFRFGHFDIFYVQLDAITILSLISLCIGLFMVVMAKKLSEEKLHLPFNYILFLIAYWFLFAMWWTVSILYKITGKQTKWWHKSGK
ncbi:MAG: glycosyltransferase family 2 protein [Candidatus Woesearchaeota archaeon]|jgi:cellulose synthase/poly-beta-1,6-N-acetylglucosamine synthase-like glycosyltransferase